MANGVNNKAFDLMTTAADKTRVDFSFTEDEAPKGVAISEPSQSKSNVRGFSQSEQSFKSFLKKLHSEGQYDLSVYQVFKLTDFWEEAGRPFIEIRPKGTRGHKDINRAYYKRYISGTQAEEAGIPFPQPDFMVIFDHKLLEGFLSEIGHGFKYARKPGESIQDWQSRRVDVQGKAIDERKVFGKARYGYRRDDKKYFPVSGDKIFSIGIKDGKEVVVDREGIEYSGMKVPEVRITYDKEGKEKQRERALSWRTPWHYTEFDPKTRLGVGGQSLTTEFDVHKVVQDSLWNVIGEDEIIDHLKEQ